MITLLTTQGWEEYALLDSGDGLRLEQFGDYRIVRPDPQAIWQKSNESLWTNISAEFKKKDGNEGWEQRIPLPEKWKMQYKNLSFYAKLTPFKHTGIFPEQSLHWDFINKTIRQSQKERHVLNLFAYTGIASLVAAEVGAKVTHVDASKPSITWARENQELSGLSDKPIRWILDDAVKFLEREIKRGVRYDGIIMDPPVYGHGPDGQRWDFTKDFPHLVKLCRQVLTEQPLFVIVNAYAISSSSLMLKNVMADYFAGLSGELTVGELALQEKNEGRLLSTGIFARWSAK